MAGNCKLLLAAFLSIYGAGKDLVVLFFWQFIEPDVGEPIGSFRTRGDFVS